MEMGRGWKWDEDEWMAPLLDSSSSTDTTSTFHFHFPLGRVNINLVVNSGPGIAALAAERASRRMAAVNGWPAVAEK